MISFVDSTNADYTIFSLIKRLILQVELSSNPANVDVARVLTGEDAHPVKVLIDQTKAIGIEQIGVLIHWTWRRRRLHSTERRPPFWNDRWSQCISLKKKQLIR